jgi:hypothetical protein
VLFRPWRMPILLRRKALIFFFYIYIYIYKQKAAWEGFYMIWNGRNFPLLRINQLRWNSLLQWWIFSRRDQ